MEIALKLSIHMEPQKAVWLAYEKWIEKLAAMSGGQTKVTIEYSGHIGIEEWDMLQNNQSDMGRVFTLNLDPFPMHTVPALPFMLPFSGDALSIVNSLYDRYLHTEWRDVKVLWLGLMSPYHIHTVRKSVRTLEDFRGLKIIASGLAAECVAAWGGTPVSPVPPEGSVREKAQAAQYDALADGTADGILSTFEVTNDFKLYEVTRYHTCLNVIRDVNATVMNLKVWNGLPPDIREVFEGLNPWAQKELDVAQASEAAAAEAILKKLDHTMIELTPGEYARWVDAAGTLIEKSLVKLDAKGVPATAMAGEIHRLTAGHSA